MRKEKVYTGYWNFHSDTPSVAGTLTVGSGITLKHTVSGTLCILFLLGDGGNGYSCQHPYHYSPFHLDMRLFTEGMCLKKALKSLLIAIRHVDDFFADVHAVVSVYLADLVDGYDIGTMDT